MDELLDLVIELVVDEAVDFVLDELFDWGVHVNSNRIIIVVYIRLVSWGLIVEIMMEYNCI